MDPSSPRKRTTASALLNHNKKAAASKSSGDNYNFVGGRSLRRAAGGGLLLGLLVVGLVGEHRMLRTTTRTVCEEAGYTKIDAKEEKGGSSSSGSSGSTITRQTLEQQQEQQPQPGQLAVDPENPLKEELNFHPRVPTRKTWEMISDQDKQPLNFLHIPKTGGSSIFALAAHHGYTWADCLFPSSWRRKTCPQTARNGTALPDLPHWPDHPFQAPWWHTPIQYLSPAVQPHPYTGFDVFAVVRNPYERSVSEYYYYCQFHKRECFGASSGRDGGDTPARLNAKLRSILLRIIAAAKNSSDYFAHWGHWIPQYDYFYNTTTIRNSENNDKDPPPRLVRHLLHNERLHEEFASLAAAYKYDNLTLPERKARSRQDLGALHGAEHLTAATMKLIEIAFERDFALGGYDMLSGAVGARERQQQQQQQSIEEL